MRNIHQQGLNGRNAKSRIATWVILGVFSFSAIAQAASSLDEAKRLYQQGQYFSAARYAYASQQDAGTDAGEANAWVTLSLLKSGLYNSATFFFIKTLESGNKKAIQRVLVQTENVLSRVGPDLLREYLVKYTKYEDYDTVNRSAYLFSLGKTAILRDDTNRAIEYLNAVKPESRMFPFALQLRATALAIQGRNNEAIDDFQDCQKYHMLAINDPNPESIRFKNQYQEAKDLLARCTAGEARVLYQSERFDDADVTYDRISKNSYVWPDILSEQAWNSYARREFNRSLGKLVTYKSPVLDFVYNSEIDVLRAQSFLSLCLYDDARKSLEEFEMRYADIGREVKRFVEVNANGTEAFYQVGAQALLSKLNTTNPLFRMANRFVRSPYFRNLLAQDKSLEAERQAIASFARMSNASGGGMVGFLSEVLKWRRKTIHQIGGLFVRNSMIDHHSALVADFEKVSFIRLEIISRAKDKLMRKSSTAKAEDEERRRGNVLPSRRDNQYYWSFNGEFWNDELGDYVFGLESECGNR